MSRDEPINGVSRAVLGALTSATSLARPILNAQCRLLGFEPDALTVGELEQLIPKLIDAVGRFGSQEKVRILRAALLSATAAMTNAKEMRTSGCRRIPSRGDARTGPFAKQVQLALETHSPLGWSLFEAQCERRGQAVHTLQPENLGALLPEFERSLRLFGSATQAEAACATLERLSRRVG